MIKFENSPEQTTRKITGHECSLMMAVEGQNWSSSFDMPRNGLEIDLNKFGVEGGGRIAILACVLTL